MARPNKHDGVVYKRSDSSTWWMRYRDRTGRRRLESTNTSDWNEAQRQLRERLQSRDNNTLDIVRRGKELTFNEWADFFPGELLQAADSGRRNVHSQQGCA